MEHVYHMQSGTRVHGAAFSDNVSIQLQATPEAVDELEHITSTILTQIGIPFEVDAEGRAPKIHIHSDTADALPVRIGFSDNTTGNGRVVTITPSLDSVEVRWDLVTEHIRFVRWHLTYAPSETSQDNELLCAQV
jgi:hypothetical protein